MKTSHLTTWEQEECLINPRSPQLLRHLAECADCRASVARLEHSVGIFRRAAVEWSAESLASRPQLFKTPARRVPVMAFRWALAVALPLVILAVALLPSHFFNMRTAPSGKEIASQQTPPMSDDALLQQVDDQLSVAVPSSMESLTHLVSAQGGSTASAATRGSKPIAQSN